MLPATERRISVAAAADVVGYSRLMGVDEDGTLATLKAHRAELVDPKIAEHGGRIVKGIIYDSTQITLDRRRHIQFNGAQGEDGTWHTRHPESTTVKALAL